MTWDDGPRTLGLEGIGTIVFRTVGDPVSLWEAVLPEELLRLPAELGGALSVKSSEARVLSLFG